MKILILILLFGLIQTPVQNSQPAKPPVICTVINFGENTHTNTVGLVCEGLGKKTESNIDRNDWPAQEWGRPDRGDSYPMDADRYPIQLTPAQLQAQKDYDKCHAQYMHDIIRKQEVVLCKRGQ